MSGPPALPPDIAALLARGAAIPAHPLALTADRKLDEVHQRALTRYYIDAGAGGIAVGVHTTQFEIRAAGLYRAVLEIASTAAAEWLGPAGRPLIRVAGACGDTRQAVAEAEIARGLGYHAALVNLGGPLKDATEDRLIEHLRELARVLPIFGFYLQPAAGGRELRYRFWRRFAEEVPDLVAIKIAAFDRDRTLEVSRGVADSGRAGSIALYTGNDDAIVLDLLSEFELGGGKPLRMVGGLLGQWAIGTRRAVELLEEAHRAAERRERYPAELLKLSAQVTDLNAALFDPANAFRGCLPGINEVLRRQRLLRGRWCLDPRLDLSAGQAEEIDRVLRAYPRLVDDRFIEENLGRWLA